MKRIPIAGPWITQREIDYAADAAENGWYDRAGEYPARFEARMAEYLGVEFAVCVPHCTAALHLSLAALGVGPGDEVIVPELTWIASSAPVQYVGATVVFADVDSDTWCLSTESFERCITSRTRAVVPVDLYGGCPDWDGLLEVAARNGVAVVEDAAEAIGSEWKGRKAGSFGDTGSFSFHGSKTLTTGEGGMLVTRRRDLRDRILVLRDHGRSPGDRHFFNGEVAFKYKMSALQAALGLAQLERIEDLVDRKREIFGWYTEELGSVPGISLNPEPKGVKNSYWMVNAVWDARYELATRDVMQELDAADVDSRPFFHPLSSIPAYRDSEQARLARDRNPVAYRLAGKGITLPSALSLTRDQVAYAGEVLRAVLSRADSSGRGPP